MLFILLIILLVLLIVGWAGPGFNVYRGGPIASGDVVTVLIIVIVVLLIVALTRGLP